MLSFAADALVVGATRLAATWGMAPVLVGVVVIGIGTSMPEAIVSVLAAAQGDVAAAIGNIAGSNAANLTLILGIVGILGGVAVVSRTLRREVPAMTVAVSAFTVAAWLCSGPASGRSAGASLVVGGVAVTVALVRMSDVTADAELVHEVTEEVERTQPGSMVRAWIRVSAGLGGLVLGAQLLLHGALDLADRSGLRSGGRGR